MQRQTVGIIGGGQLGRMLIQAGINYPVLFHVYSNSQDSPARPICASYTVGDLNDFDKIVQFGQACDILTIEIENVNIEALKCLRDKFNKKVWPQPEILEMIKDRLTQKEFLVNLGVPTMPFLRSEEVDFNKINYPKVNKLRVGGYDGYGTKILKSSEDKPFDKPSILEDMCRFDQELAVQIARNSLGEISIFPIVEMRFTENNMLDYLVCPFGDTGLTKKINEIATQIAERLNYVGLLAIELFQQGDNIYVNELAPRPHNSGHHTQDMFSHSQFDLLMRSLLDLSLPKKLRANMKLGATINILGFVPDGKTSSTVYHNFDELCALDDVFIHVYDKDKVTMSRKMGHVNILADTMEELTDKIKEVKRLSLMSVSGSEQVNAKQIHKPKVGIIMGSSSDLNVMRDAIDIIKQFELDYEVKIVSAHRTPEMMLQYGSTAQARGIRVIIAGAGGAAHLPGMIASCTNLPVIGVPIKSSNSIDGWDSMLSILQMPAGVPVATVGLDNSRNAGLLAVRILGENEKMEQFRDDLRRKVDQMNNELKT